MNLRSFVSAVKGIGSKTEESFHKIGIITVEDLLHYYPRSYDVFEEPTQISQLGDRGVYTIQGIVATALKIQKSGRLTIVSAVIEDSSARLKVNWFNMPYMKSQLAKGDSCILRGRVTTNRYGKTMEQPTIYTKEAYLLLTHSMQPLYSLPKGISNRIMCKAVDLVLSSISLEKEYIPAWIKREYELADLNFAIRSIHFPSSEEECIFARKRLVFEEFFFFILAIRSLKGQNRDKPSNFIVKNRRLSDALLAALPYKLTKAQNRVLLEIRADMEKPLLMNRLIQGDVGSGKTIVAVLAMLDAAANGFQSALMAPTEVLAHQHYENISNLLSTYQIEASILLMTGSMTAKEKREAYEKIQQHQVDIVVGTHAIIQEKVSFASLGLVITDEQHRFGVGQRQELTRKGEMIFEPHVIVMSATPIPRTLAIILYGDLDISIIDELPSMRLPIKTCVVGPSYRPQAYDFIAAQVKEGRQAYVICPLALESEMADGENVVDYCEILRKALPPAIRVEYLHGKMKPKEKNERMEQFAANDIQVLVSTTVVEVGVDVANATVIMIENAERFGLAGLHQLRGRVGRGAYQSYCILLNTSDEEKNKRLNVLNQSNDGFFIASEDLKLRGPGDLFGIRQSGLFEFTIGDIFTDASILKQASEAAERLLKEDPGLEDREHLALKQKLGEYFAKKVEHLYL